jgi:hypothetical protein
MVILVSYDINKTKDYLKIHKAMDDLGKSIREVGLDTAWFVHTNYSIEQIQTHLTSVVDPSDRIFITKINPREYSGWLSKETWDWILERL